MSFFEERFILQGGTYMSAIDMEKEDIKLVMDALEVLDVINNKYGNPHGKHPMGIILAAYAAAKTSRQKQACKCGHDKDKCCNSKASCQGECIPWKH